MCYFTYVLNFYARKLTSFSHPQFCSNVRVRHAPTLQVPNSETAHLLTAHEILIGCSVLLVKEMVTYCIAVTLSVMLIISPRSRVLIERLIVALIAKKYREFYGSWKVRYLIHSSPPNYSVSRARWVQSMLSYSISLHSLPISSSHFPSSVQRNLFSSGLFSTIHFCSLHTCHMSRPSSPASLSRSTSICWEVQNAKFHNM
jgi:hypothetical protein